jgi:hypothetical protein
MFKGRFLCRGIYICKDSAKWSSGKVSSWETGRSEFDSRARRLLKARHDVKFIHTLRITTVNK